MEPGKTWLTPPSAPPGGMPHIEPNGLQSTDVAVAHGIPLLVTQTHPDHLSTRCPMKLILALENYLKCRPISQLKNTSKAKQRELSFFKGPLAQSPLTLSTWLFAR